MIRGVFMHPITNILLRLRCLLIHIHQTGAMALMEKYEYDTVLRTEIRFWP